MSKTRRTSHREPPAHKPNAAAQWFSRLSALQQDLLAIAFLYVVALVLFGGIVFNNAAFSSAGDTATATAYIKAGDHLKETEGVDPLWMPYIFSGMPTFGNVAYVPHNVSYVQVVTLAILKFLFLNATAAWMIVHYFLGGVFMFFLMRLWGFARFPALFAALTFMLSPYAIGLAQEGHGSKLQALSYLPMIFLLTHLLLDRRDLLSFGLFAAGIGTLLLTNHMQIVYYVLMSISLYLIYQVSTEITANKLLVLRKVALMAGGIVLGLCISSYIYLSVYEYSHYSIRGGGTAGVSGGLTWDYATNWSFHPFELMTYLIPSFFGFSSIYPYVYQGQLTQLPLYWGTMPFTTSTMYVGLMPIVLSAIALIYRRNRMTIFFGILTVLIFLVSFGKHFAILYDLLFTVLPFFNKFRAPSMILQLIAFTTAVLGGYGLSALLDAAHDRTVMNQEKFKKALLLIIGVAWAVLLIGVLFRRGLFNFLSDFMFAREGENYTAQVIARLKEIRFEVFWDDYVKFVLLATASLGGIWLFLSRKISRSVFSAGVLAVLLIDLFIMDGKFINPTPYRDSTQNLQADETITFLKEQPGLYRTFPVGELGSPEATVPYTYNLVPLILGYHPAKLKIYQTMIDSCLYRGADPAFPINMNIVNMLNTRYLLAQGQLPPDRFTLVHADQEKKIFIFRNPGELSRAFFVDSIVVAGRDHEVFSVLNSAQFNAASMAVLERPLPVPVSSAPGRTAEVVDFKAHKIVVHASTPVPSLMVLSEVYYPAGWDAYIDGAKTEIFKTNYILRSVIVPPGNHTIEFRFEPAMYALGWKVSNAAWILSGLCIVGGAWLSRRKKVRPLVQETATPKDQGAPVSH